MVKRKREHRQSADILWVIAILSLLAVIGLGVAVTWWTSKRSTADMTTARITVPLCSPLTGAVQSAPASGTTAPISSHRDFFTNDGLYMPRTHCLLTASGEPDWFWIGTLITLSVGVILAYLRIYHFWFKSYLAEERRDRNQRLMDLAQIFLWCAVCGYATSVLMFFWPAYRLLAICLLMLNIWSWKFAFNLSGFRSSFSAGRYRRLAETDRLTGLPNRHAVLQMLEREIVPAEPDAARDMALLFLDFDQFKMVNDSLGHDAGDDLLKQIASRLTHALEQMTENLPDDVNVLAARLGGDEFVVLLIGTSRCDCIDAVCRDLRSKLDEPYTIAHRSIHCTASIGVTSTMHNYATADEMLRDADTAMYVAKQRGRARAVHFNRAMHEAVRKAIELENGLRVALQHNELLLYYQPVVCLESGDTIAFEALLRWNHPEKGLLSPIEFIKIAEDSGLIVPIGRWVIDRAVAQLAAWRTTHEDLCKAVMNINVSPKQLGDPELTAFVKSVASKNDISCSSLCLEITETAIMQDRAQSVQMLHDLRREGFKLAMDDFGTGYSSLSCLHEFPLNTLKIDRSFVANLTGSKDYAAVVHAIASLAGNLGFSVVAEGVETPEQVSQLQAHSCNAGQGHYFQPAAPVEEIEAFISRHYTRAKSA